MLKKIIGYILAIAGCLGFIFFDNYKGHIIPYPWLWFIISIAAASAGIYLIYLPKWTKLLKERKERESKPY